MKLDEEIKAALGVAHNESTLLGVEVDERRLLAVATFEVLTLFQKGVESHLDLCLWFGSLEIRSPAGMAIPLEEFCAGGRRWWDAMHAGDHRTDGHGIVSGGDGG